MYSYYFTLSPFIGHPYFIDTIIQGVPIDVLFKYAKENKTKKKITYNVAK